MKSSDNNSQQESNSERTSQIQKDQEKDRKINENQMSILGIRKDPRQPQKALQMRVQRVNPELIVMEPSSATINTYRILGDYSAAKRRHMSIRIGEAQQSQMVVQHNQRLRRQSELIKNLTELRKLNHEESIMEDNERECQSYRDRSNNETKILEQLRINQQPKLQLSRDRGQNLKRHTTTNVGLQSSLNRHHRGQMQESIDASQIIHQTSPNRNELLIREQELVEAYSLPDPSIMRHHHSFAEMTPNQHLEIQNQYEFNNIHLQPISERDNGDYISPNGALIVIPQQNRTGIPPELQSENMALAARQAEEQQEQAARLSSIGGDVEMDPQALVEVRRHKKEYLQLGLFQTIIFVIFLSQLNMQWKALIKLYNSHFECFCFIWVNMLFYVVSIVLNIICYKKLDAQNYKQWQKFNTIVNAGIVLIAFWGIENVISEKMIKLVDNEPKVYGDLFRLVIWMVWIRLLIVLVIIIACVIFCIMLTCMAVSGRRQDAARQSQRLGRLPGVKLFLEKRARMFNPTANNVDKEIEQCVICLDDFKESDGKKIAELNCNEKHIFHVDCLKEWIEKNDICPMCREPIIKQDRQRSS